MSPFELERSLDDLWPRWARSPDVRTVLTLYDLIPFRFPEHYMRAPSLRSAYLARAELVRRADHILAISASTAHDAEELLGIDATRITVIDAGVSKHFAQAFATRAEAERIVRQRFPEIHPGFVLYVAGIEFRKNIHRLISAHARTSATHRQRHQLVITCRTNPEAEHDLRQHAVAAGLSERDLVLTDYVSDAELAALYWTCDLFAFASLYEGSGLPMLEAMACGVPVVASRTSTSTEILLDDEGLFDPFDVDNIASALESTLADAECIARLRRRSRERVRHYTWDHVAQSSLVGYDHALRTPRRIRRVRPRIALITPWPPDRSGIANYNVGLVNRLGRDVEIDVIVNGPVQAHPAPLEPNVRLFSADNFGSAAALRDYDHLVYVMGNSEWHHHVLDLLREHPGVVVAHDVRLTGFYQSYAARHRPDDPAAQLADWLEEMYGDRLGQRFTDGAPAPPEQAALGIYMTQEVQKLATHLIVHSRYAADILRLDRPLRSGEAPATTVLPLAFPWRPVGSRRTADPKAPLIVTLGFVNAVKNPQVLIEAFALLAENRPGARLVFAGYAPDDELERWRQVASQAGVEERVHLGGYASEERWTELLETADIAVQLRLVSNGEASAAAAECLGAGIPTVVTDHGWFHELPDEAVTKVPVQLTAPRLAEPLAAILDDPLKAKAMSTAAQTHAHANSFAAVATRYQEALGLGQLSDLSTF
jgi:glycosyltransferase involved in cell wall biosynthesis